VTQPDSLFDSEAGARDAPGSALQALEPDSWIRFLPGWLSASAADDLHQWLLSNVHWSQATLKLFGKCVRDPRLSAWFSDRDYTYSGRTLRATPWPEPLAELRRRVEHGVAHAFNSVLLNRYRDGNDGMGFHADAEPELGRNPVIASVSLGSPRRFVVTPKLPSQTRRSLHYDLGHGSLLVMGGSLQHHYRHALPKRPGQVGERLNLTFRWIQPSSE
jgi:alkylated DNA repair dioxygenase AlkB